MYEEPLYGISFIKRFTFGGMINNKDYRLAPEKSKVLYFAAGCPEQFYVKFKPAKNQKIHQMLFEPLEMVDKGGEQRPVVELRSATARGIHCEVSLENMMACGLGACLCCVTDTDEGHRCVCKEGPVFDIATMKKWYD